MSGWNSDMSAAPIDGTFVDLWTSCDERVTDCRWDAKRNAWVRWWIGGFDSMDWVRIDGRAVCWMSVPQAPTTPSTEGQGE